MKLKVDEMDLSISRTSHLQVSLVSSAETVSLKLENVDVPVELRCVNGNWTFFIPPEVYAIKDSIVAVR